VTLANDTVESHTSYADGGLFMASGAAVYLDSFTVANTINDFDGSGPNGPTANIEDM
jgi:hypothetical protein